MGRRRYGWIWARRVFYSFFGVFIRGEINTGVIFVRPLGFRAPDVLSFLLGPVSRDEGQDMR